MIKLNVPAYGKTDSIKLNPADLLETLPNSLVEQTAPKSRSGEGRFAVGSRSDSPRALSSQR